jgi:hypothetical protein
MTMRLTARSLAHLEGVPDYTRLERMEEDF